MKPLFISGEYFERGEGSELKFASHLDANGSFYDAAPPQHFVHILMEVVVQRGQRFPRDITFMKAYQIP